MGFYEPAGIMIPPEHVSGIEFAYLDRLLLQQHGIDVWDLVEIFRRKGEEGVVKKGSRTLVRRVQCGGQHVYLKRYSSQSWAGWIRRNWAARQALQAFYNARWLAFSGIGIAPLLAVAIRDLKEGNGDSGLFTLSLAPAKTITLFFLNDLSDFGTTEERRKFLREAAEFLKDLHGRGIYPKDFKDTNVLVQRASEHHNFFLVDCDSLLFLRSVSFRRRRKNLYQLGITFGEALTREERLFLLGCYSQDLPLVESDFEKLECAMARAIRMRQRSRKRLAIIRDKEL